MRCSKSHLVAFLYHSCLLCQARPRSCSATASFDRVRWQRRSHCLQSHWAGSWSCGRSRRIDCLAILTYMPFESSIAALAAQSCLSASSCSLGSTRSFTFSPLDPSSLSARRRRLAGSKPLIDRRARRRGLQASSTCQSWLPALAPLSLIAHFLSYWSGPWCQHPVLKLLGGLARHQASALAASSYQARPLLSREPLVAPCSMFSGAPWLWSSTEHHLRGRSALRVILPYNF